MAPRPSEHPGPLSRTGPTGTGARRAQALPAPPQERAERANVTGAGCACARGERPPRRAAKPIEPARIHSPSVLMQNLRYLWQGRRRPLSLVVLRGHYPALSRAAKLGEPARRRAANETVLPPPNAPPPPRPGTPPSSRSHPPVSPACRPRSRRQAAGPRRGPGPA